VRTIGDDVRAVRNDLAPVPANVAAIGHNQIHEQRLSIMEWLSPSNDPAQQCDIISQKENGTGQWFIDSPEFKIWHEGHGLTLFCPGIPGAGKTMIAAITVSHLQKLAQDEDIGIGCLFYNYKMRSTQSTRNMLAALLKQLVQSKFNLSKLQIIMVINLLTVMVI